MLIKQGRLSLPRNSILMAFWKVAKNVLKKSKFVFTPFCGSEVLRSAFAMIRLFLELILNPLIKKTSLKYFISFPYLIKRPSCDHIENSQLICRVDWVLYDGNFGV